MWELRLELPGLLSPVVGAGAKVFFFKSVRVAIMMAMVINVLCEMSNARE